MDRNSERSQYSSIRRRRTGNKISFAVDNSSTSNSEISNIPTKKSGKGKKKKNVTSSKTSSVQSYSSASTSKWKKHTDWEAFDPSSNNVFDEEVASVSTTHSKSQGTQSKIKNIQNKNRETLMGTRVTKNFNFKTLSEKQNAKKQKGGKKKPYAYVDKEDNLPVEVVYQDLSSSYIVNKLPAERETKTSATLNSGHKDKKFRKSRVAKTSSKAKQKKSQPQGRDIKIKMEESFEKDLLKRTKVLSERNGIERPDFEGERRGHSQDESLSLSPIRKSRAGFNEVNDPTFDEIENDSEEYVTRNSQYDTKAAVRPLYRPTIRETRPVAGANNTLLTTPLRPAQPEGTIASLKSSSVRQDEISKQASSSSYATFGKKRNSSFHPQAQDGFRDLMKYSNFQEVSYDKPEIIIEEESYTTTQKFEPSKRDTFFLPEENQGVSQSGLENSIHGSKSVKSFGAEQRLSKTMVASEFSTMGRTKSRVRRYGKKKHERETALR